KVAGGTVPGTPGVGLGKVAPGVDGGALPPAAAEADGEGEGFAAVLLLPQAMSTSAVATTRDERMSTRARDVTPWVGASIRNLESRPGMIGNLKVGVGIPASNEADSLARLLPRIPRNLVDQVVVVNDAS